MQAIFGEIEDVLVCCCLHYEACDAISGLTKNMCLPCELVLFGDLDVQRPY